MKTIRWLRIVLAGLAMEIIYGLYISFLRWYEESILTSVLALGCLMLVGGYLVGRKVKTRHLLQGALVGLVGVLFYVFVMTVLMSDDQQAFSGSQFWLENLAKIGGGAIGGYIALKQGKQNQLPV